MDSAAVVRILQAVVQGDAATFKQVNIGDLPGPAAEAIKNWLGSINALEDLPNGSFVEIAFVGALGYAYVADFEGDDPDPHRLTVVIQDGAVVGESVQVAE